MFSFELINVRKRSKKLGKIHAMLKKCKIDEN
jgi:hypothetical protein